jgi:putative tricarboxylic transport membrane protein
MRILNFVPAAFVLTLSALILQQTYHLQYYGDTSPGPAFFPFWLAGAGLILFVFECLDARALGDSADTDFPDRSGIVRVVLTFGGLILFPVLSPAIGMIATCALYMAFLLIVVLRQRLIPSAVTIAVTVGLLDIIFIRWLGIALPAFSLGM